MKKTALTIALGIMVVLSATAQFPGPGWKARATTPVNWSYLWKNNRYFRCCAQRRFCHLT